MSDEAIKAQKRAKAAGKRAEASRLSSQVNMAQSNKNQIDQRIQKLEKAIRELTREISNVHQLKSTVSSQLKSISENNFKGTRRNKYNEKVRKVESDLSKYVTKNQENLQTLQRKLTSLQEEAQREAMTISLLNSQISALLSAAISLDG
ncbi:MULTISPECIES: DUF5082 family protein [Enterococcus]|uniref:DUF5082 family protein n=1 Tax=Enterococcus TaxID=1350 RepID=UPI000709DCAA|nr:DUF5082 family protein [Enterococcus faecalis]KXF69228.1 hypothetical protein AQ486_14850 [Enterococcus faecalis]KXF73193.1 hypothetical protein AQ487_08330 [Enterococcus faecalis]MBC2811801.1 DUF5082 domain-containing protein [Enterococcus faecalis]MBC2816054.1 DUF5082 domain-containing protein [Enterococcus faecalis]MBC2818612.1 DUF5082 domain-containing protein [Enterococcus faecalis]